MSTWSELRQTALRLLDMPATMTGEIPALLDTLMLDELRDLAVRIFPDELFTESATLNVGSAFSDSSPISISTDFLVTDLFKPYTLILDLKDSTTPDFREWEYMDYSAWVRAKNVVEGNIRPPYSWTYNGDSIYLSVYPTDSSTTWDLKFIYYRKPAEIVDGDEPEIPEEHHKILYLAAVIAFPHLFQGDRQSTLALLSARYKDAKDSLLQSRTIARRRYQLKMAQNGAPATSVWPGYQTS